MRILDLFSGIGGFSLGLERAGMETVAFCEFDKKAQLVLKKHWPDVPIFDDVRELNGEQLKHLYPIDLICGGFPCQPFSVAGKQRGEEDDRHLWPEYFRLIQEIRPRWVIGENVSGLINMGLDQVLADLESEDYSCQTLVIPACAINAPHRRDRVWILAFSESLGLQGCGKPDSGLGGRGEDGRAYKPTGASVAGECEALAHTSGKGLQGNERIRSNEGQDRVRAKGADGTTPKCGNDGTGEGWWATEPSVGRVAHGFSNTLDEIIKDYGYENINHQEAISKIDNARREILREMWGGWNQIESPPYRKEGRSNNDSMHQMSHLRTHERWKLGQRFKEEKELHDLWKRICAKPFQETQQLQSEMLERVREIERYEKVASSRVDRLKQLGNAVVPQVVEVIGRAIMEIENG